ncbi:hypothetical protein [Vibrio sp. DNB22_12_1]
MSQSTQSNAPVNAPANALVSDNSPWGLLAAMSLPMSQATFYEVMKSPDYKANPTVFDQLRRDGMKVGM